MVTFVVFDGDTPAKSFGLDHAHLFGPDDVPIPAAVEFEQGKLLGHVSTDEAAGMCVLFAVDPTPDEDSGGSEPRGVLVLRTCLLPPMARPALLSLELARRQIMMVLTKLEDWALTELGPDSDVMQTFERARRAFTEALVAPRTGPEELGGFTPVIDRAARVALSLAISAGERLAEQCAARDLPLRRSGRVYADAARDAGELDPRGEPIRMPDRRCVAVGGSSAFGCSVFSTPWSAEAAGTLVAVSDFLCMPMSWIEMEPTEGKYSFTTTDRWIEWAIREARIPVVAGPLIDFAPESVPEWLYIWENDYETLRDLVAEHLRNVVTRYRRTVSMWNVACGLHVNSNLSLTFEQVLDLTRLGVMVVRKLHPGARVVVELDQPWGEYHAENRRSIPPLLYAEMIAQAGIQIDGIAVRLRLGQPAPGCAARDLLQISELLDRVGALERPVCVTGLGVPSVPTDPSTLDGGRRRNPGHWRSGWSPQVQADWASAVLDVVCAKPFVQTVCWQQLMDTSGPRGSSAGLLDHTGQPKPVFERVLSARANTAGPQPT